MTIELNRDNYEAEVNQSDRPVLVDFWGPRCNPSMALMPSVEKRISGEEITKDQIKAGIEEIMKA
jgi:thioredoxin 1